MKKILLSAMLFLALIKATPAMADTTINLSPADVKVNVGQTFNVDVWVDPQTVKNGIVELKVSFPANLVQVQSFKLDEQNQWILLNQPGYYSTDNSAGLLVRTAGYSKGFNTKVKFGTITFTAVKGGLGPIAIANGTSALDQSSKNVFTFVGSNGVNVNVRGGYVAPAGNGNGTPAKVTITGTTGSGLITIASNSDSGVPSNSIEIVTSPSPTDNSLQQANALTTVGNILNLGTGSKVVGLFVVLVLAYLAFLVIKRKLS